MTTNPADDRDLRLPILQDLNFQVRTSVSPVVGHRLDFYVDALNVLNLRTPTGYGQQDLVNFGVESSWAAPFRIRLGMNYKF